MNNKLVLMKLLKKIKKNKLLVTLKHNDFNVLRKFSINFNFSINLT